LERSEDKRSEETHRHKWGDKIKMYLIEIA
jgi:hypothetical protein